MNRNRICLIVASMAMLLAVAGCRQEEPQDLTPTPPIVDDSNVPDSDADDYPAPDLPPTVPEIPDADYPAPESPTAVPPDNGDGGDAGEDGDATPETPGGDTGGDGGDSGDSGGDTGQEQPGNSQTPVVPVIGQASGTAEALPEAAVSDLPSTAAGSDYVPGSTVQHTVSKGEWLLQVARCYGADYETVRTINQIPLPDYITPGLVLTIPNVGSVGPVTGPPCVVEYVVLPGDTWDSIAAAHDTTAAILQNANPGPLTAGRTIYVPSANVAQPVDLPSLTHHLVFINDGNLAVWRSSDSLVETTVLEGVTITDIATNSFGRYVLAYQTRDNGATYEVALYDTVARTGIVLETGLRSDHFNGPFGPDSELMLISPNDSWGVYATQAADTFDLTSFQVTAPDTLYSVRDIPVPAGSDIAPMTLFSGSDTTTFLTGSAGGIHEFPYSLDRSGRQIVSAELVPVAWSPDGRSLLLAQGPFSSGGSSYVVDATTSNVVEVPDSNSDTVVPAVFWQSDGSLDVVLPPAAGTSGPRWVVYGVADSATAIDLTAIDDTVYDILEQPSTGPAPGYTITAPVSQALGSAVITIGAFGADPRLPEEGIWSLDAARPNLQKDNDMPYPIFTPTWMPDGSGMMLQGFGDAGFPGDRSYIASTGGAALSLSQWLGTTPTDFHWVRQ